MLRQYRNVCIIMCADKVSRLKLSCSGRGQVTAIPSGIIGYWPKVVDALELGVYRGLG